MSLRAAIRCAMMLALMACMYGAAAAYETFRLDFVFSQYWAGSRGDKLECPFSAATDAKLKGIMEQFVKNFA